MPRPSLKEQLRRCIPFIGYHHVLMMILAASWIILALLLAGCSSSTGAMSDIYILGLQYGSGAGTENAVSSQLKVRVGYFGLCAQRNIETQWFCASGGQGIKSVIVESDADPLGIIEIAANFKQDVIFSGLLIGAMALSCLAFFGLASFPGWTEERDEGTGSDIDVKPFPSRAVSQAIAFVLLMASLLILVSCLWQHVAAASVVTTVSSMLQKRVVGHVGAVAAVLVWLSLTLVVFTFLGILVMIISIYMLDLLAAE